MTGVVASWPVLLGGRTQWTVGLVATLISVSSIIAADTCAFIWGKVVSVNIFSPGRLVLHHSSLLRNNSEKLNLTSQVFVH